MGAQQQEMLLTPVVSRRPLSIDSMILQIDSDARQRREGEKRNNSVNSFGKRFDHPPPSLVDELLLFQQHTSKRRRVVSFDAASPTSLLAAFDEASDHGGDGCKSSRRPKNNHHIGLCIRLRPRHLGRESYSLPSTTREIPFMPF